MKYVADTQLWFVKSSLGNRLLQRANKKRIQDHFLRVCKETDFQVFILNTRCQICKVAAWL